MHVYVAYKLGYNVKKYFVLFFLIVAVCTGQTKKDNIELPRIFSDNMVLQQKALVPFWGKALPGVMVKANSSWGDSAETVVKEDSTWRVILKTPEAGGPYNISLQIGDSLVAYKNVLSGEVWLCSGQSNMEMPLTGWPPSNFIDSSKKEIANANYNDIRLFTVERNVASLPQFNCKGSWSECNSETAASFSATAYFFGRKLYEELHVPIGLIHSSWGGTPIESWTSGKYLGTIDEYKNIEEELNNSSSELSRLHQWLNSFPIVDVSRKESDHRWEGLDFHDSFLAAPDFDDSKWHIMKLPAPWETGEVGTWDGVVWFRKKINIPADWIGKNLLLTLGPIDDMDITYINGKKVGGFEKLGFYDVDRVYDVPAELVTDTSISIAVRVLDTGGMGGIYGKPAKMKLFLKGTKQKVSLAGEWRFLPIAEYDKRKFYLFDPGKQDFYDRPHVAREVAPSTPANLYNAMIAPLIPYRIKGVIWYQGESNTTEPQLYKKLFPLMIKNWREEWHQGDFPFYYVQIAPYEYDGDRESQFLREAQFETLSVPKTGMAVTLDIGNPKNIHPSDKQDVGKRLALWALAKDYNIDVIYSGPLYKSMKRKGNKIILSFDHTDSGLVIKEINGDNNFIVAGKNKKFRKADVKIDGDKLIISSKKIRRPYAVRYAWGNAKEATLFNNAGLPSSSFRTDDWDK